MTPASHSAFAPGPSGFVAVSGVIRMRSRR